jgi:hypothetical protein
LAALIPLLLALAPTLTQDVSRVVAEQFCAAPGAGADVLVCGKRRRDERYRMPGRDAPFDPDGDMKSVAREHGSWGDSGATGTQSCGAVGPGGWTGCMVREWDRRDQQTQYGKNRPRQY